MAFISVLRPLSLGLVTVALSGNSLAAYDDGYYKLMVSAFDTQVRPRLQSLLPASERNKISGITIDLLLAPDLPTVAMTKENPPKVIISLGFLDGLFQHIDCVLLENSPLAPSSPLCRPYFAYYFAEAINRETPHPDSVAEYLLGGQPGLVDQWYTYDEMADTRDVMMMSALIFVFMHEFGHHISGFYDDGDSLSVKRSVEGAADEWAAEALAEINERPILGAAIALGYIARMEAYREMLADAAQNNPQFVQLDAPHPRPEDRVKWSFERYCSTSALVNDPASQQPCNLIEDLISNF